MMLGGGSGASSTSGSRTASSSARQSDTAISGQVREALAADASVNGSAITVSTHAGAVKLSGKARSYTAREAAEKLALAIDGVKSVDNQITVNQ